MPQVNQVVSAFSLKEDMANYYRGTYVTYEGKPAYVMNVLGRNENVKFEAQLYGEDGQELEAIVREVDRFDLHLPQLGFVKFDNLWFHLSRNPQRRMRKGYGEDMIRCVAAHPMGGHCPVTHPEIIKQIWFGNQDRISPDCVIVNREIYFQSDVVANIDQEGNIIPVVGKEKLGEFVCKLLAANWDNHSLKYSLRTPNL